MSKRLLWLVTISVLVPMVVGGCGPSAEDFTCAQNWLQKAKDSRPRPNADTVQDLDEAIRAAKSDDFSSLTKAMDNVGDSLMMTLALGDFEHLSPDAAEYWNRASICIKYCPKQKLGKCSWNKDWWEFWK